MTTGQDLSVADDALDALFSPRSIAIVGASRRADSLAARPLDQLDRYGFDGDVFPVNPSYDEVGARRCYPSVLDLPGPVDLAALIVPARATLDIVSACVAVGVRTAILFSSGFAELGAEGRKLQDEIVSTARQGGMRLLGPNCQGVMYRGSGLVLTISASLKAGLPRYGSVAYVGQSGAIGGSVMHVAGTRGMGLGAWVSTGNESDIDLVSAARHLIEQEDIRVLACYLESVQDGGAYEELAARTRELDKDMVVLRSGQSQAGKRAVASHTGALLRPGAAFDGVSLRHGVTLVDDTDALFEAAFTLSSQPRMRGRRIGIITSSGGAGILVADHAEAARLEVPELSPTLSGSLATQLPEYGAAENPVDLTAQLFAGPKETDRVRHICLELGRSPEVDAIVVALTTIIEDVALGAVESVIAAGEELDKPVLTTWLAGDSLTEAARERCREAGVPVYRSARDAIRAARVLYERSSHQIELAPAAEGLEGFDEAAVRRLLEQEIRTEGQALGLLDALGVPRPRAIVVTDADAAQEAANGLEGLLVLKIESPDIAHKTEAGGVRLRVPRNEVAETAESILQTVRQRRPDARIEGLLVQELAPSGVELLVGLTAGTGGFPPLLTLGFGGTTAELYRDVASVPAPVTEAGFDRLLSGLMAAPLLTGFRGSQPADLTALRTTVMRVSAAFARLDDRIETLEINPLIVAPQGEGVWAADALVRLMPDGGPTT